jgi:hypothetical protein
MLVDFGGHVNFQYALFVFWEVKIDCFLIRIAFFQVMQNNQALLKNDRGLMLHCFWGHVDCF